MFSQPWISWHNSTLKGNIHVCVISFFNFCLDVQKLFHIYFLHLEWNLISNDTPELNIHGIFRISVALSVRAVFCLWSPNDFKGVGRRSPGCGPQDTNYLYFIFLVFRSPLKSFTPGKLHESLVVTNMQFNSKIVVYTVLTLLDFCPAECLPVILHQRRELWPCLFAVRRQVFIFSRSAG